jgi:hypothetical protein
MFDSSQPRSQILAGAATRRTLDLRLGVPRMTIALLALLTALVMAAAAALAQVPVHRASINNAPRWRSDHSYKLGEEVATPGGAGVTHTRGYKAIKAGTSCDSGSGPSGTGAQIGDCGVTWKYLSDIDYTSISLWLDHGIPRIGTSRPWQPDTRYLAYSIVSTTNGSQTQAYQAQTAGKSCAAPAAGPSGSAKQIADCGVSWRWLKSINPSADSRTANIPAMAGKYIGEVYNGGEYLNDGLTAASGFPNHGYAGIAIVGHNQPQCCGETYPIDFNSPMVQASSIVLTAAPGESIADMPDAPLSYDPSKGVAIRCTRDPTPDHSCLDIGDWNVFISRIQVKSSYNGITFYTHGAVSNTLVDADGEGVWTDSMITLANDVIYAGNIGVGMKYHDTLINSTVLGKAGAVIGVYQSYHPSFNGAPVMSNNAVMGFRYCAAYSPSALGRDKPGFELAAPPSDYNATDVGKDGAQSGMAGITWRVANPQNSGQPATSMPCPGAHSLYHVPFTNATFRNAKSGAYDARLAADSALLGKGAPTPDETAAFTTHASPWPGGAVVALRNNCSPTPAPYGANSMIAWCFNPLMRVTGNGMPPGTSVVALGGGKGYGFAALSAACDDAIGGGCGQTSTLTFSYASVQSADFFGVRRPQSGRRYDIGAYELPGVSPAR